MSFVDEFSENFYRPNDGYNEPVKRFSIDEIRKLSEDFHKKWNYEISDEESPQIFHFIDYLEDGEVHK